VKYVWRDGFNYREYSYMYCPLKSEFGRSERCIGSPMSKLSILVLLYMKLSGSRKLRGRVVREIPRNCMRVVFTLLSI
jgi:hypothetical protein